MNTNKLNSGIRIAGGGTSAAAAANEDQLGRNDLTVGWDPYHVWRTRVKEARSSHVGNTPIDSDRKRRRD